MFLRCCRKGKTVTKARRNDVFLFCALVILCAWGCAKQSPPDADKTEPPVAVPAADVACPLTGHWRSVKLQGADIGSFIKEIRYTFAAADTFVAEAAMNDGSTDRKQGLFKIEGNQLLRVVDGASLRAEFALDNGTLVIYDHFLDTKVWFEKDPSQ